ncbi:type II secretion system F family protein [Methylobacterium nodulans]|uniref:Type II secretion system protein n=1 Tax=Methylobacterium nodulans (strain LMG 21967 / CNCM I-2342 / ORS 2060) TaxID=460265 RepID=B8IDY8_METNO|nr:type II secretion system F family protein [Methylobacterium nodulans]ACL57534.1 type II secretion system protein [Methylobacterium nodulans ORS 2060]
MTEPWLIYFLIFSAVFLTVQFGFLFFGRGVFTRRRLNRRLSAIEDGTYKPYLEPLRRKASPSDASGLLSSLTTIFAQAGGASAAPAITLTSASAFALCWAGSYALVRSVPVGMLLALLGASTGGIGTMYYLRRRRVAAFGEQLPELLEIMVRSLRAGHPLVVAFTLAAKQMPDPAGSEIGITADEIGYGRDVGAALYNLYRRVGFEDLRFFATAVTIQAQTGGNLAEILARLATLLRERARLRQRVRALSAEGRLSALALSLFPFLLAGLITLLNPDYYGSVWGNPLFDLALTVAGGMLIIGNIVLYRIVNFRI